MKRRFHAHGATQVGSGNDSPVQIRAIAMALAMVVVIMTGLPSGAAAVAAQPPEVLGNAGVAHRLFEEVFNEGDLAVAEEIVSGRAVTTTPGGRFHGAAGCADLVELLRADFPGARFTIRDTIVSGDTVVVHWSLTDTGRGNGAAARVVGGGAFLDGVALLRIDNYLIVELWMR